ncbi:Rhs family protein-like precursor [uncultured Gammaproteobacteria bacterium]|nr:Rhs family protein-like precursor [uncultured Gammaproteobacteria bacterium]
MGLIHMNGRVYDPQIGRFLSADPYIQSSYNTQSYNRYSYTINNPLKYTDPMEIFWLGFISAMTTKAVIVLLAPNLQNNNRLCRDLLCNLHRNRQRQSRPRRRTECCFILGIGELRGGKMGANGKMQYNQVGNQAL